MRLGERWRNLFDASLANSSLFASVVKGIHSIAGSMADIAGSVADIAETVRLHDSVIRELVYDHKILLKNIRESSMDTRLPDIKLDEKNGDEESASSLPPVSKATNTKLN